MSRGFTSEASFEPSTSMDVQADQALVALVHRRTERTKSVLSELAGKPCLGDGRDGRPLRKDAFPRCQPFLGVAFSLETLHLGRPGDDSGRFPRPRLPFKVPNSAGSGAASRHSGASYRSHERTGNVPFWRSYRALPSWIGRKACYYWAFLEPSMGIEPMTSSLPMTCSTAELQGRSGSFRVAERSGPAGPAVYSSGIRRYAMMAR